MVANEAGISHGSAFSILYEHLALSKLSACWVPKALREDRLAQRANMSLNLLRKIEANKDDFMKWLSTGDEIWIPKHDPENKVQSKQWLPLHSSGPIKVKP